MHGLGVDPPARRGLELVDQVPAPQQADAVGHLAGAIHVVGHHQDGLAGIGQGPHQVMELVDGRGVEPGGGLVEQQDVGVTQDGQRDGHLLAHALGVAPQAQAARIGTQRDPIQRRLDVGVPARHARQLQKVAQVLARIQVLVQRRRFRQISHRPARSHQVGADLLAVDQHPPAGCRQEAQEGGQRRRLAGAVAAQQPVHLTPGHGKADAGQHLLAAALHAQLFGLQPDVGAHVRT